MAKSFHTPAASGYRESQESTIQLGQLTGRKPFKQSGLLGTRGTRVVPKGRVWRVVLKWFHHSVEPFTAGGGRVLTQKWAATGSSPPLLLDAVSRFSPCPAALPRGPNSRPLVTSELRVNDGFEAGLPLNIGRHPIGQAYPLSRDFSVYIEENILELV